VSADTPRTDALLAGFAKCSDARTRHDGFTELCRQLERELAAEKEKSKRYRDALAKIERAETAAETAKWALYEGPPLIRAIG